MISYRAAVAQVSANQVTEAWKQAHAAQMAKQAAEQLAAELRQAVEPKPPPSSSSSLWPILIGLVVGGSAVGFIVAKYTKG